MHTMDMQGVTSYQGLDPYMRKDLESLVDYVI